MYIVIPRGSRAHITAASKKKSPLWRFSTVFDFVGIRLDQFLQHFDRCLLKFGNGDLPISELHDSIHIPPEYLCEIQDYSGIGIRVSLRYPLGIPQGTLWRRYSPTSMRTSMLQDNSGYLDGRKGNTNTKEHVS